MAQTVVDPASSPADEDDFDGFVGASTRAEVIGFADWRRTSAVIVAVGLIAAAVASVVWALTDTEYSATARVAYTRRVAVDIVDAERYRIIDEVSQIQIDDLIERTQFSAPKQSSFIDVVVKGASPEAISSEANQLADALIAQSQLDLDTYLEARQEGIDSIDVELIDLQASIDEVIDAEAAAAAVVIGGTAGQPELERAERDRLASEDLLSTLSAEKASLIELRLSLERQVDRLQVELAGRPPMLRVSSAEPPDVRSTSESVWIATATFLIVVALGAIVAAGVRDDRSS
ncbi:MAG: hypothetical protein GY925_08380 [Actinomycetia bacterium]|nr:hypothetical protein [Actinomycetes bacterium]